MIITISRWKGIIGADLGDFVILGRKKLFVQNGIISNNTENAIFYEYLGKKLKNSLGFTR